MSNYEKHIYKDLEKEIIENEKLRNEYKLAKLRIDILESENQRKNKIIAKHNKEINDKDNQIKALKDKIIELTKNLELTEYEKTQYLAKLNNDGTNSGIPTSQTPINKKKVVPNSRQKTGNKIGAKPNHKKSKLEKFEENEVNDTVDVELDNCPKCNSDNLIPLESKVTKDELDYQVKVIKKRYVFKEYKCLNCGNIVRKQIPNNLKEDNQYGSKVQATALTLANVGNVPINKIKKILCGLTMDEINLSEGYIAKLQKRAALKLSDFIRDIKFYITHLSLIYWDDTVIMVNTKRACMRFYGNEDVALYTAHEQKNKAGVDEDNILTMLTRATMVEHDHNILNYNDDYSFVNLECCQHLIRDLQKVKTNIPNRTWSVKMKELFQEYDHKRKELIEKNIDHFSEDELDSFISNINQYLLLGTDEYSNDSETYYADKEAALLIRLMEYRDNYIYWILDFDLPFTNNLSERGLRGIKSKMKVAGQFQNIKSAENYAIIRSYIETCSRNNVNEHLALEKLIQGNPYTLEEILQSGKNKVKKSD